MYYTYWNERASLEVTNEILKGLALVHASRINSTPEREFITSCIASGDILNLCNYNPSYAELTVGDALNIRQVCAFYSKRADIDAGVDRRRTAVETFIGTEQLCAEVNDIFRLRESGKFYFFPDVEAKLFRAQSKISHMMGDVPSLSDLQLRFGPGATTQVNKRIASPSRKLGQTFACSEDLLPIVKVVLSEFPTWVDANAVKQTTESWIVPVEVHYGELCFVPKSWKTERSIVKEPMLNTMCQLGIGDYLSSRFKRLGLDLTDQSANQRGALLGSLTGALATLDLSSASDTISIEAVATLLPIDWFLFLKQFRSGTVSCEGIPIKLEKFSSNGNGFTFPLESIIFYGLAISCVNEEDEHLVRVFGDDIVVPTYAFDNLCNLLNTVGFVVNGAKSFAEGPFRESCGADYMKGIDIRPSYVKDSLALFDIVRLHNQYVRRLDEECAQYLLSFVPPHFRKWGPDGYGDGHLIGDGGLVPYGRDRGWSGFTFETYTLKPKRDFSIRSGDRVYPFYSTYASNGIGGEPASLQDYARDFEAKAPSSHAYKKGVLGVSIPGTEGVNLIKIYTLSSRGS